MFTGIVTHRAVVDRIESADADIRMRFSLTPDALAGCKTGDSISVSGICLTALEPNDSGFAADLSTETLSKTTAGSWVAGTQVNIERAMAAGGRFDGHLVTGHVDGTAKLVSLEDSGRSRVLGFEAPSRLQRYLAPKGSVCLDGVSLTVNEVHQARFSVCIIPHTMDLTGLGDLREGDEVNFEVDLVARYLERMIGPVGEFGS